jgi:hypothetical protein
LFTRKNKVEERKRKNKTALTKLECVALKIAAPPEAKLAPPKKDTFLLLFLIIDTRDK